MSHRRGHEHSVLELVDISSHSSAIGSEITSHGISHGISHGMPKGISHVPHAHHPPLNGSTVEAVVTPISTSQVAESVAYTNELIVPDQLEIGIIGVGTIIRTCFQIYHVFQRPYKRKRDLVPEICEILVTNAFISLAALVVDALAKLVLKSVMGLLGVIGGAIATCLLGSLAAGYLVYEITDALIGMYYCLTDKPRPAKESRGIKILKISAIVIGIAGGATLCFFFPPAGIVLCAGAITVATTKFLYNQCK